jgi:hypothetical protein
VTLPAGATHRGFRSKAMPHLPHSPSWSDFIPRHIGQKYFASGVDFAGGWLLLQQSELGVSFVTSSANPFMRLFSTVKLYHFLQHLTEQLEANSTNDLDMRDIESCMGRIRTPALARC